MDTPITTPPQWYHQIPCEWRRCRRWWCLLSSILNQTRTKESGWHGWLYVTLFNFDMRPFIYYSVMMLAALHIESTRQPGIHKELDPEIMCKSSYEWMNDVSSGSYKPWEIKLKSFIRGLKSVQCSWTWVGRWTMMSWTKEGIASMMMTQLITNRTIVIHFNFTDKVKGDKVLDKGGWMKR